jgi:Sec-independent protein secretion pathway component TatC
VHFQALYEKSTIRRTAAMLIAFGGVFLLPVVALLLAYNLLLTTRILLDLF